MQVTCGPCLPQCCIKKDGLNWPNPRIRCGFIPRSTSKEGVSSLLIGFYTACAIFFFNTGDNISPTPPGVNRPRVRKESWPRGPGLEAPLKGASLSNTMTKACIAQRRRDAEKSKNRISSHYRAKNRLKLQATKVFWF